MEKFSGILETGVLEILPDFTERTLITQHGPFVICKAKRFGKWVKLKSLATEYRGNAFYEELLKKEFSIGISLDHPCIARTDSFLKDEELGSCILEEYVDGETLREWLSALPTMEERRKVARQILEAVEYIHGKGVVHRDIKPSNIIITSVGSNVKLIDFGLSDTAEYAIFKQRAGTSGYIAPEVLKEIEKEYDWCLADIYSLGMVLREMKPGFPYGRIARRAANPDPERRWKSVSEMLRSLRRQIKAVLLAAVFFAAALLVSGTFIVTDRAYSLQAERTSENVESAFLQADSTLTDYYSQLEDILNDAMDAQEWNTSTTTFYARYGYPVQFVDSLTSVFSKRYGLDENTAVLLRTRLESRMNHLHNDGYFQKVNNRWNNLDCFE